MCARQEAMAVDCENPQSINLLARDSSEYSQKHFRKSLTGFMEYVSSI
jgi:hypothetical protein